MTTVSIFSIPSAGQPTLFHAVAGDTRSIGNTAGEALDAISAQLSETEQRTLVIVQHMQPDQWFTAEMQQRLADLMQRWRDARSERGELTTDEQVELNRLIELELQASGERAQLIKDELGK